MKIIKANQLILNPPKWAVLEQELFNAINATRERILGKYARPDGTLFWPTKPDFRSIDGLDDCYESFHNWPLFYILGGDDEFLTDSKREFDAITECMAKFDTGFGYPMVVKEYQPGYDWFHQGEGNYLFYMLCMADPADSKNIQRAMKFSGFYMNEDPEVENYDAKYKIIRCARNGSKGPAFWTFAGSPYWPWPGYNLPFYDVPGCTNHETVRSDRKLAERLGQAMKNRQMQGDSVVNLAATTLATNAYLITGQEKYIDWVKEYVNAWISRTQDNHGIVPDNVGLSGKIGEHINGKWYGSNYGWTWPHGWHSVGQAVGIASQNIALLTKDSSYMSFVRSQIDVLISRGIQYNHQLYVPYKYGDPGKVDYEPGGWLQYPLKNDDGKALQIDGWFEFMPMHPSDIAHLWTMTMDPKDMERFQQIRKNTGSKFQINTWHHAKDQGGHDGAWLTYLLGEYPEYPEDILKHNLEQVKARINFMENDRDDPEKYSDSYFQRRNPVTCEGLVQLTMGGPLPHYNGGLLVTPLRYFDMSHQRPGLPKDVSVLVSKIERDCTQLEILNLSQDETREVLMQAGSMGEHCFTEVFCDNEKQNAMTINHKYICVQLQPYTQIKLELKTKRFVYQPKYENPFL
ncbi:hypothetical protein FJZ33_04525 [Candidatus Poribacteria bacterium]|nr:hypothetical protein [Candidatus Poribacteria bacterium]